MDGSDGWINLCVCAPQHATPNQIDHPSYIHPFPVQANKAREMTNRLHAHARKKPKNEIKPGRANKLRSEAAGEENGSNEQSNRLSIQIIARPRKREIGERQ